MCGFGGATSAATRASATTAPTVAAANGRARRGARARSARRSRVGAPPPPLPSRSRARPRRRPRRRATGRRGRHRARAPACRAGRARRPHGPARARSARARPSRAGTRPRRTPPRRSAPRRSAAAAARAACPRARPSPRSERGVEVDADPVRILELRVALTPERVPRLLLAVEAGVDGALVRLVDLRRARALEGERDLVAGRARPVGPEAADDLLGAEHEADAVRE